MEENGAAHSWNPAWQLISPLRSGLFYIWATLIAIGALLLLVIAVAKIWEAYTNQKRLQEIEAAEQIACADREEDRALREEEEKARKESEHMAHFEREHEIQENLRRIQEEKRNRSSKDAIQAALDEF